MQTSWIHIFTSPTAALLLFLQDALDELHWEEVAALLLGIDEVACRAHDHGAERDYDGPCKDPEQSMQVYEPLPLGKYGDNAYGAHI